MPFLADHAFELPDDQVRLWRYMDVAKYLHLIHTGRLWFSCVTSFDDPWEGSLWSTPKAVHDALLADPAFKAALVNDYPGWTPADHPRITQEFVESLAQRRRRLKEQTFVSCWHEMPRESAAMWDLYSQSAGIAVVTTFGRLKASLAADPNDVRIARVVYRDDYSDLRDYEYLVSDDAPFLHKRDSFAHEHELRAWIRPPTWRLSGDRRPGIAVQVDCSILIESVRVAPPPAPTYLLEAVRRATEAAQLNLSVEASELGQTPQW